MAEIDAGGADWAAQLPPHLLLQIINELEINTPDSAFQIGDLRLVCKRWSEIIPISGVYNALQLWEWDPLFEKKLSRKALALQISSPTTAGKGALFEASKSCSSLRSLTLDLATIDSLLDLAPLRGTLKELKVTLSLPRTQPPTDGDHRQSWLSWASCLTNLTSLDIKAATPGLMRPSGLHSLTPLIGSLQKLAITDCFLSTHASAVLLSSFTHLDTLSLTPSRLSEEGIHLLRASIQKLTSLSCACHSIDEVAAAIGVGSSAPPLTGLTLLISMPQSQTSTFYYRTGDSSSSFSNDRLQALTHLKLIHSGSRASPCSTSISAALVFPRSKLLETLKFDNIDSISPNPLKYGEMTSLKSLDFRLHCSIRDDALTSWSALTNLTKLRFHGNWYLNEPAIAAMLSGMKQMRSLSLSALQGDVEAMLSPIADMQHLHSLALSTCRLTNAVDPLVEILTARGRSLHSLSIKWVSDSEDVAAAVSAALPSMPHLRSLVLRVRDNTFSFDAITKLSSSLTKSTALTNVHVASNAAPWHSRPARIEKVSAEPFCSSMELHWKNMTALSRLHSLTVCVEMGWSLNSLAAVCTTAPELRALCIIDGLGAVTTEWLEMMVLEAPQLMNLSLHHCRAIEASSAFRALGKATALTELKAVGCPSLVNAPLLDSLKETLPMLAKVIVSP